MFDRWANGWALAMQSWAVLRKDKQLVIFPILSGLACLLVLASFIAPLVVSPDLRQWFMTTFNENAPGHQGKDQANLRAAVSIGLLFLFYLANYFVIVFFNTALVACAVIRFSGGEPTLGDGLRAAGSRIHNIFGWALVAATVGVILKVLEDKADWLGQLVLGLIGAAWSVVTYFVVPVLAVENVGPFAAVKQSASLLRKSWGEGIVGNFGLGLIGFLLYVPGILLLVVAVPLAGKGGPAVAVTLGALGLVWLLAAAVIMSTLEQIFLAGLYLYAAQHRIPDGFDERLMHEAFRKK
jgi:hypothetical protein